MKILLFVLLCLGFVLANAQDVYFSNQPFELGKTPDPAKCKTQFSDDENIYGIVVYDKPIKELIDEPSLYQRKDGSQYYASTAELKILFGGKIIGKWLFSRSLIVGVDDKSYLFIDILPDADHLDYVTEYPTYAVQFPDLSLMMPSYSLEFKNDRDNLSFKGKIRVKKTGSLTEEGIRNNQEVFEELREKGETCSEDYQRGGRYLRLREPFNPSLACGNLCKFEDQALSKSRFEQLFKEYGKGMTYPPTKIIKIYSCQDDIEWTLYKNNLGGPLYKLSQPFLVVADSDYDSEIYFYDVYYLRRDYEGGESYSDFYMSKGPRSRATGAKGILKELIDNYVDK